MVSYLVLAEGAVLRRLEMPAVYQVTTDTLFEVDEDAFEFLLRCAEAGVQDGEATDRDFVGYCLEEGLLERRGERPEARHAQPRPSPVPSLRYLELQITSRCNLRCRHCYLGPARPVDLPPRDVDEVVGQFEQMQGLRLLVSGGEPLLHPEFRELNAMFRTAEARVVLLSNGTLIDGAAARKLHVHEVQVSLDGMKSGHDTLRGPGSFEKAVGAVRHLLDAGKTVSVATMVHAGNVGDFDEMADFLHELGVSEWSVDAPCDTGTLSRNRELLVPPETAGRLLAYGFGGSLHEGGPGALCGSHLMTVTADGMACKCGYYTDRPVGHVKEGLDVLWGRLPRPGTEVLSCACRHLDDCRGGCRYRAERAGDPFGPDPVKCAQFGAGRP